MEIEGAQGPQSALDMYAADFGAEQSISIAMGAGDAVAYRGVDQAFDGAGEPKPVNFTFSESKAIA